MFVLPPLTKLEALLCLSAFWKSIDVERLGVKEGCFGYLSKPLETSSGRPRDPGSIFPVPAASPRALSFTQQFLS